MANYIKTPLAAICEEGVPVNELVRTVPPVTVQMMVYDRLMMSGSIRNVSSTSTTEKGKVTSVYLCQ